MPTIEPPFLEPATPTGGAAARAAAQVVRTINTYGCTVIVNGTITVLCIPDEDVNKINQYIRAQRLEDVPEGRTVLFNFAPNNPDDSVEIRTVFWDGQYFTIMPARSVNATNVRVMKTVMGVAGGGTY